MSRTASPLWSDAATWVCLSTFHCHKSVCLTDVRFAASWSARSPCVSSPWENMRSAAIHTDSLQKALGPRLDMKRTINTPIECFLKACFPFLSPLSWRRSCPFLPKTDTEDSASGALSRAFLGVLLWWSLTATKVVSSPPTGSSPPRTRQSAVISSPARHQPRPWRALRWAPAGVG